MRSKDAIRVGRVENGGRTGQHREGVKAMGLSFQKSAVHTAILHRPSETLFWMLLQILFYFSEGLPWLQGRIGTSGAQRKAKQG